MDSLERDAVKQNRADLEEHFKMVGCISSEGCESTMTQTMSNSRLRISEPNPQDDDGFDSLLSIIGFGKWQLLVYMIPIFAMVVYPMHLFGATLLIAPVDFRCFTYQELGHFGDGNDNWRPNTTSDLENSTAWFDNQCLSDPVSNKTLLELPDNFNLTENQHRTELESCPIVEYDTSVYTSTIVTDFNLICKRSSLRPLYVTSGRFGNVLGCIVGGYIGDRWGRLFAVKIGIISNILSVAGMVVVPSYYLILVASFLCGITSMVTVIPAWSIGLECTPPQHRSLAGMLLGLPFCVSFIAFAGMGYLIRNWNFLFLAGSAGAPILLIFSFVASESPRWLLQKGRVEEAREDLQLVNKLHGKNLEVNINYYVDRFSSSQENDIALPEKENPSSMVRIWEALKKASSYLRSPTMRTIIICMGLFWIFQLLLYSGIVLNANNFASKNPFLYVTVSSIVEAAAIILVTPLSAFVGRRTIMMFSAFVSGGLFIIEIFIPEDLDWLHWILVMSGFFIIAGSQQLNYVYTPEVFPTESRARGFAFGMVMGNVGASLASFVTSILPLYVWWGPAAAFGASGIVAGIMLTFLPETKNMPLADTVEELEERHRKKKMRGLKGVENRTYCEEETSKNV